MLYIYDKRTKQYYTTDENLVLLNSTMMIDLNNRYKNELKMNFGKIEIDPDTFVAYYKPHTMKVIVDELNNVIPLEHNMETTHKVVSVDKKEYYDAMNEVNKGNRLLKYFEGKLHIHHISSKMEYDPETNSMVLNFDKYKEFLINLVNGCENEVRNHGYYYTFWDNMVFAQPFRVVPDNDLQVFKSLKEDTPENYRGVKLFMSREGKRLTEVGTYKWIKGPQVTDTFLQYQINMITTYSGFVKDAIFGLVNYIKGLKSIQELAYVEANYIDLILNIIHTKTQEIKELTELKNMVILEFKSKNILPLNDLLL